MKLKLSRSLTFFVHKMMPTYTVQAFAEKVALITDGGNSIGRAH